MDGNFDSREIITPIFQLFLRVIIETPYTGYSKMHLTMKSSNFARSNAEFPKSPTNSQPKKPAQNHKGRLWSPIGSNQHLHAIVEIPFAVVPAANPSTLQTVNLSKAPTLPTVLEMIWVYVSQIAGPKTYLKRCFS